MINIDDSLNELFTFTRDESPPYRKLREQFEIQTSHARQIDQTGLFPNVYGTMRGESPGRSGLDIYDYCFSKWVRRDGECISAPGIPESLSKLRNSEYAYFGLRLITLAYMTGKKIGKLTLIDTYNGQNNLQFLYKPYIATDFLKWASGAPEQHIVAAIPAADPTYTQVLNTQQTLSL